MAMDIQSIRVVFKTQRFTRTRDTVKLDEYQAPTTGQFLYIYKDRDLKSSIQVVIHPDLKLAQFLGILGVSCPNPDKFRHGSNMREFPRQKHRGETETPYGRSLEINSLEALEGFLKVFDTPAGSEREGADLPPRLTAIELENFKGIGERVRIELAPITLLFGANSAGKSTILQALQYVREVLDRRNANPDRTVYGGDFVDLGGFRNLVHQRDLTKQICIKLELNLNRSSLPDLVPEAFEDWQNTEASVWEFASHLQATKDRTESVSIELKVGWSSARDSAIVVGYEAGLNGEWLVRIEGREDGKDAEIKVNTQNPVLMRSRTQEEIDADKLMILDLGFDSSESPEPISPPIHQSATNDENLDEHRYSIWPIITGTLEEVEIKGAAQGFRQWLSNIDGALPNFESLLYVPTGDAKGSEAVYIAREFTSFLSTVVVGPGVLIRDYLRKLRYVGPIRKVPVRQFEASLTPNEARWADGTAAWESLLNADKSFVKEVSDWMSAPEKLATGYEVECQPYKEISAGTLNLLLRAVDPDSGVRMDPAVLRELEGTPAKNRLNLIEASTGIRVQPADIGIGISQVLPVVVAALDPAALLVSMEQPELHIHPAVQVGLGDLLIKGAKEHGICFLIETHSEHLVLRLMRRIRETEDDELPPGAIGLKPSDLGILYVQPGERGTTILPLPVDTTGEFTTSWPKGFFEERAGELF